MHKLYKIISLTLFVSLPTTVILFTTTSCANYDYSLYYRSLKHYKGKDIGLDISLFEVDFSSFIGSDTNLKNRLDTLNTDPTSIVDPVEYVGYRTFSFVGQTTTGGATIGTGWIISRVVSNINDNYRYWIMTNQHVTNNWLKNNDTYQNVYWDTSYDYGSTSPNLAFPIDYNQFPTNSVKVAPEKVDAIATDFQNSLITPFYNGTHSTLTPVVAGGYPNVSDKFDNYYQQWNFEDDSTINSYYRMYSTYIETADLYMYENSYEFSPNSFTTLGSGASGSMVIDKNTHEVLGVYWGVAKDTSGINYPLAVILNTNGHAPIFEIWHEYNKMDVISTIVGTKIYNQVDR